MLNHIFPDPFFADRIPVIRPPVPKEKAGQITHMTPLPCFLVCYHRSSFLSMKSGGFLLFSRENGPCAFSAPEMFFGCSGH